METFFALLSDHYPIIAIVLITIAGLCVAVYKISMYHASIQNTKEKVEMLPCGTHGEKLESQSKQIDRIDYKIDLQTKRFDNLDYKFDVLKTTVDGAISKGGFSKRRSPWELTDLGIKLAKDNNFYDMIDRAWDKISEELKSLETINPYDLQNRSINIPFEDAVTQSPPKFFSEDDINRLKILAYKTDADLWESTRVIGILIRDRYFSENGIDAE